MRILVTGAAGYIGSHTCLELLQAGYEVVAIDNLANSKEESLRRVQELAGKSLQFHRVDLMDKESLNLIFKSNPIDAVIHFAGLKAVGESVAFPLSYYHNNVVGTIVLCEVMGSNGVKNIVFSSSATVYGDPPELPIREDFPLAPANPYGQTKLMIEQILQDIYVSDNDWSISILRYFNPVGAHPSGRIGEDPDGIPNNLLPFIAQVAVGKLAELSVFGYDYPTPDGTGVRDYIHIVDLAAGHVKALPMLMENKGVMIYNLGTGRGQSVLEMIKGVERASGKAIPFKIAGRRPGDIAACYADPSLANRELGWKAERTVDDMCADTWRWQSQNPNGYE